MRPSSDRFSRNSRHRLGPSVHRTASCGSQMPALCFYPTKFHKHMFHFDEGCTRRSCLRLVTARRSAYSSAESVFSSGFWCAHYTSTLLGQCGCETGSWGHVVCIRAWWSTLLMLLDAPGPIIFFRVGWLEAVHWYRCQGSGPRCQITCVWTFTSTYWMHVYQISSIRWIRPFPMINTLLFVII